jgi:hypothetical protein
MSEVCGLPDVCDVVQMSHVQRSSSAWLHVSRISKSRMAWTRLLLRLLQLPPQFGLPLHVPLHVPDLHRLKAPHWSPRPATLEARSALIWGTSVRERPRASHNSGRKSPCEKALADKLPDHDAQLPHAQGIASDICRGRRRVGAQAIHHRGATAAPDRPIQPGTSFRSDTPRTLCTSNARD